MVVVPGGDCARNSYPLLFRSSLHEIRIDLTAKVCRLCSVGVKKRRSLLVDSGCGRNRPWVWVVTIVWLMVSSVPPSRAQVQPIIQQAKSIALQAGQLEEKGQWSEGLRLRREMVQLLEKELGRNAPDTDHARRTIADSLSMLGRHAEARAVLEVCLEVRTNALGENHQLVADIINRIGETYRREGLLTNALPCYARAQAIFAKLPGQETGRAFVMVNEGIVLASLGDNLGAERKWVEVLQLLPSDGEPLTRANALTSLGELHRSIGKIQQAVAEHRQALTILSNFPPQFPNRLIAENNLASALRDQRQLTEAIAIYENSIRSLSEQRGPDDLDVIVIRRNLAQALALDEDHAAALGIIEDLLKRLESPARRNHPVYGVLVTDQADRLQSLGDLTGAIGIYERTLASLGPSPDPEHRLALDLRERLGSLALAQGSLGQSHAILSDVLTRRRVVARKDSRREPELAETLVDFATFQLVLGRFDLARNHLEEALSIQSRHLPPHHPKIAATLEQAGICAQKTGHPKEAIGLIRRALDIRRTALGDASPQTAMTRLLLGETLLAQGEVDAAASEIQTARAGLDNIRGPERHVQAVAAFQHANILHRRGGLEAAAPLYERALGYFERHGIRHAIVTARDLALLELDRSRPTAALQLSARLQPMLEKLWGNVLRFSSEQDRLSWQGTSDGLSLFAAVAPHDARPLANAVLRFKGLVLDSLIEDTQLATLSNEPAAREDVLALAIARRERLRLELAAGGRTPPASNAVAHARSEVERLEAVLARRSGAVREARNSLGTTIEAVQSALPPETALVEYIRYQRWLGRGRTESHVGALVFSRSAPPRWIELGSTDGENGLSRLIARWQESIRSEVPLSNAAATNLLQSLHDRLWHPVERALSSGEREIIIAPDAEISFVPFAALWRQDRFLGEEFFFRYVTSGRDLLTPDHPLPSRKPVCVFAEPEYERPRWRAAVDSATASVQSLWRVLSLRGGHLSDLPAAYPPLSHAKIEGERIADLARTNGFGPVVFHTGAAATKARLRDCGSPYLLHLATHGTFLPDPAAERSVPTLASSTQPVFPRHPMVRSWVALARANETLDAWRRGEPPDPADDGLLTAAEAASLDLSNTWLVTLSACDTGLGVARTGEGLFGLRRGFALAGARHVLLTLWPVSDKPTRDLMEGFYSAAFSTGDAPGSLSRIQREKLAEWRKSDGPSRAARWAGPFLITSRGR